MSLSDPEVVARDYASESRLLGRRSIYETSEGPSTVDLLWDRIVEAEPRRILDVGPGPGELSERMARELGGDVVAIDLSPRLSRCSRSESARSFDTPPGAITAVLALVLGPVVAISFLPENLAEPVEKYSLMGAGISIQQTVERPDNIPQGQWAGLAVVCAYAAVALLVGLVAITRRDA